MFGLSSVPSSVHALLEQLAVERLERAPTVTSNDALDRVVAVHQHLGLDDRHDAGLLAQRRVPRQRVRVDVDAVRATAARR